MNNSSWHRYEIIACDPDARIVSIKIDLPGIIAPGSYVCLWDGTGEQQMKVKTTYHDIKGYVTVELERNPMWPDGSVVEIFEESAKYQGRMNTFKIIQSSRSKS